MRPLLTLALLLAVGAAAHACPPGATVQTYGTATYTATVVTTTVVSTTYAAEPTVVYSDRRGPVRRILGRLFRRG
jgi:hypothetical protein